MNTEIQIRSQILMRIKKIPSSKLKELNDFVSKLEEAKGRKIEFYRLLGHGKIWKLQPLMSLQKI